MKNLLNIYLNHKKVTIPVTVLVLALAAGIIGYTVYNKAETAAKEKQEAIAAQEKEKDDTKDQGDTGADAETTDETDVTQD